MAGRERARKLLLEELTEAVGEDRVDGADLDVDRAIEHRPRTIRAALESSRLMLLVVGAALLVTGIVASLALESWLLLPVALVAHALFTVVVVVVAFAMIAESEKPAPTTEAALADEGVRNPGRALDHLVDQVEEQEKRSS